MKFALPLFLISLLSIPLAMAANPEATFLPERVSANSSFLLIVSPNAATESSRVTWVIAGMTETSLGQIPKKGDRNICYYSTTDPKAECGPSPFTDAGEYELDINVTDSYGTITGKAYTMQVGDLRLAPKILFQDQKTYILWHTTFTGGLGYKVYKASDLSLIQGLQKSLAYDVELGGYRDVLELGNGDYYFVFSAEEEGSFGGAAVSYSIGSETPGTGTVKADSVDLDIVKPAGEPREISIFKIKNLGGRVDNITIKLAEGMDRYILLTPQSPVLEENGSIGFSVKLVELNKAMNITTVAEILSRGSKIGEIPVKILVSVVGSPDDNPCKGKPNKASCDGGKCCSEVCVSGAECCLDTDCSSGGTCTSQFRCKDSVNACSVGECVAGNRCPAGYNSTGATCAEDSVCCVKDTITPPADECEGAENTEFCDNENGICCGGICIAGGQCCASADCDGKECINNACVTPPPQDNTTLLIVIIALAVVGVGGFILFRRSRSARAGGKGKKRRDEEEGEEDIWGEEEGKESKEEEFSDEEEF